MSWKSCQRTNKESSRLSHEENKDFAETVDEIGFGDYKLIQADGFRYGVDSVLLAAFAAGETGARTIGGERSSSRTLKIGDLGSGSGIIPLILAHKLRDVHIWGIEVDTEACDRARRSVELNDLGDCIRIFNADVLGMSVAFPEFAQSFDAIVTNPPYFKKGAGIVDMASAKARARHETTADLSEFLRAAQYMLCRGGDFYMVHRPDRIVDILTKMREAGIEPKELQLVTPRAGTSANILLVHGIKSAGVGLTMLPDIAVRREDDSYSDLIQRIYER